MTLEEINNSTRGYLDDDSNERFQDTEINRNINIAYNKYYNNLVNRSYPRLLSRTSLTFTSSYADIPVDYYIADNIYKNEGSYNSVVPFYSNRTGDEGSSTGLSYVTIEGNSFRLNNLNDGTYTLSYYPILDKLDLQDDEPVQGFIEPWHELIAIEAAIICKAGREEDDVQGLLRIKAEIQKEYDEYLDKANKGRSYIEPFFM